MNGLVYIKRRFENDELERDDMEWLIEKVEELDEKYKRLLLSIEAAIDENNKK